MSGDRARGDWTPWPVSPDQLELAEDDYAESDPPPPDEPQASDQGKR